MDRDLELRLVAGLRAGETGAFDAVYAAYHVPLFSFLARLSRRRDVAEDLVGEVWLRLAAHRRRLRGDTRLAPWLFTVARNLYLSYCRSRRLEQSHAPDLIGLWPFGTPVRSPLEALAASEGDRRLEAALEGLPSAYREVLLLVAVQGLAPADAAAVCGIRPAALRQRLHRARQMLARRLDVDGVPRGVRLLEAER